jgi:pimeloyl-ACP methyl ester carboxylesterase
MLRGFRLRKSNPRGKQPATNCSSHAAARSVYHRSLRIEVMEDRSLLSISALELPGACIVDSNIDSLGQVSEYTEDYSPGSTAMFNMLQSSEVTSLSFRDASGNPISSIHAGQTVYLRADATGMNGQTIDVELWEDDGIGDDKIVTKSITIGITGYGTTPWVATWQGDDGYDPFNMYYLFYDVPWSITNLYSGQSDTGHFLIRPPLQNTISGKATQTTKLIPSQEPVSLVRVDASTAIDSSYNMTWIIIHGWNSNPQNFDALVSQIHSIRTTDQVLVVDWSVPANWLLPDRPEGWIEPVAKWTSSVLSGLGFASSTLNFIGHSFGANVSAEIAERIVGNVNSIVALDPAEDVPYIPTLLPDGGLYNPNSSVHFSNCSEHAWAFYSTEPEGSVIEWFGGNPGNEQTPTTADEAIVVTGSTHSGVVDLFANTVVPSSALWRPCNVRP